MNLLVLSVALALNLPGPWGTLGPAERKVSALGRLEAEAPYRLEVALGGSIGELDRVRVTLTGPGGEVIAKTLHAGDPDFYLPYRPAKPGDASLALERLAGSGPLRILTRWSRQEIRPDDRAAFESEPNDRWGQANPIRLGRPVYGSGDDVDYLENPAEGRSGLDWFRFEVPGQASVLAYFQLELLDRDVSANLRVHRLDPTSGEVRPHELGKDPMEIVHDRERERYSTHLSRTLAPGIYFVEVNANHPDYVLRTRTYPIPPLAEPERAVEAGLDYLLQAGDAWFAQIPREGNLFVRSGNLHDTATRCTACHASSFPTEAALVGQANGYPIRAKASMRYLVDRLANSPTPLYGDDGLYWQRFIAIPLQSQGKQGGIVLDFERDVLGRETPRSERFGPFLKAAWRGRRDFPADEMNGVVPLDSKFGLAWRDWRVLTEMTRRSGQVAYAQAADAIADLLDDPATDLKVETLQDRIHRLYAWWVVDKEHFAPRIESESAALLALQNPDGGWHEVDRRAGPSAVYTTGQLTWTLLKLGMTRDDPRIARALAYLLGQQQPFGGWFQTTTHENFRTPMRETRYAIEALAEAYPRASKPLKSWGNRDNQAARIPRTDSTLATLDDLDNLWDVPEADRTTFAGAILPLLDHPEPLVRAHAASCLGRLGDPSAVDPLVKQLGDPSKIAWRAAAWALRQLGNAAIGLDAIGRALESPELATRRGATRIFAYQFDGMDTRADLAGLLIDRTSDPDLWVRLQALRSLRQWFYRTGNSSLKRKIVDAYLARMADPQPPVVRKALVEGMYILLDENLGGGVSLQRNLAALPARFRDKAMKGREAVERDVLLGPILAALGSGNARQREALVASFDGSFFEGRSFARQPSGMLDVGNDREFGFLYSPPADLLDRTFAALLGSELSAEGRRGAIRLASFFLVTGRSDDGSIQAAVLRALTDPDAGVREAAATVVGRDLALAGAEGDPTRIALVRRSLLGDAAGRRAVAAAIARHPTLLELPEIRADLRSLLARDDAVASLAPLLRHPGLTDAEAVLAIGRAWPGTSDPADRLALLDAILARPALVDRGEPSPEVLDLLRLAVVDRSAVVRERTLATLGEMPRFRDGKSARGLWLASLADDTPSLRRLGMTLADADPNFWARPDALERLLALLIDPDATVRDRALACIERYQLAVGRPSISRRLAALLADPPLRERAEVALRAQGYDPATITADVSLGRPRRPDIAAFRDRVNPFFYQAGEDGTSCAKCHATHSVLRISEAGSDDPSALIVNYQSALKVLNPGDPEASLLARKPRSPQGQGGPDPSSPTGLSHVGGPRWETEDHPAYRAILGWLREASTRTDGDPAPSPSADSYAPGFEPNLTADGDRSTYWQTEFIGASPGYPHDLTFDLGAIRKVEAIHYTPRQDQSRGRVSAYEVSVSADGKAWPSPAIRGEWVDDATDKIAIVGGKPARFVRFRGLSEVHGQPSMSAAEVAIESGPSGPTPPPAPGTP